MSRPIEVTQADKELASRLMDRVRQYIERREDPVFAWDTIVNAIAEAREEGRRNPTASCPTCAEAREDGRKEARDLFQRTLDAVAPDHTWWIDANPELVKEIRAAGFTVRENYEEPD